MYLPWPLSAENNPSHRAASPVCDSGRCVVGLPPCEGQYWRSLQSTTGRAGKPPRAGALNSCQPSCVNLDAWLIPSWATHIACMRLESAYGFFVKRPVFMKLDPTLGVIDNEFRWAGGSRREALKPSAGSTCLGSLNHAKQLHGEQ